MNHYVEIKLKPDAEIRENVLLNKVYTEFHKALFDLNSASIGISFPDYQLKLGNRIRIHGEQTKLEKLQSLNWLGVLANDCAVTDIRKTPEQTQHRVISRKQSNMTQAKLNRLLKRGTIQQDQIRQYKAKMFSHSLDNPFLELESTSNGHKHRRYLAFGELRAQPVAGQFDFFGLSSEATVPWF
jgi:CRISPR-associated endonuclease Csy4